MKAEKLYELLEKDFELNKCKDDWRYMDYNEFITSNFKERYMGLLTDNTKKIKKVYTAVFPSNKILEQILKKGEKDVLLFTHHPMIWDIRKAPDIFTNIDKNLLKKFKENRISIQAGYGIRYVLPQKISPDKNIELLMRVTEPNEAISISFFDGERIVKTKKFSKVHPAQMIKIKITKKETKGLNSLKVEVMKK